MNPVSVVSRKGRPLNVLRVSWRPALRFLLPSKGERLTPIPTKRRQGRIGSVLTNYSAAHLGCSQPGCFNGWQVSGAWTYVSCRSGRVLSRARVPADETSIVRHVDGVFGQIPNHLAQPDVLGLNARWGLVAFRFPREEGFRNDRQTEDGFFARVWFDMEHMHIPDEPLPVQFHVPALDFPARPRTSHRGHSPGNDKRRPVALMLRVNHLSRLVQQPEEVECRLGHTTSVALFPTVRGQLFPRRGEDRGEKD